MRTRPAMVFLLLAAVVVTSAYRLRGPEARGTDTPAGAFSAARAFATLQETVGGTAPHPVTSSANAAVRDRIVARFKALGYETRVDRTFACDAHGSCATVENILATQPGAPDAPAALLVAHYDSVPAGPGASDDGVGVAAVLEVARAMRGERRRNPVAFLIDDGEEAGLLGAEAFVANPATHPRIGALVNLEARGTSGPSFLFETSGPNGWYLPRVAAGLGRPITSSLFAAIYDLLPNDTDLSVFKRAGVPGVNFAFTRKVVHYHTPLDDLAHVDGRSLQHHGDNALSALRSFASMDLTPRAGRSAVWFDVLGFFVVSWPAQAMGIASLAVLLLIVAASFRRWTPGEAGAGLASFFVAIAAAGAAGYGVSLLTRGGAAFVAWPQPAIAAMWLTGLAVPLAVQRFLRRRDLLPGHAIGWAALATAVSFAMPGASYLFFVPAAFFLVAVLVRRFVPRAESAVQLLTLVATAIVWIPLALLWYDTLGATGLPAIALSAGLVATTLAPLSLELSRRPAFTVGALLIVCVAASKLLPTYTHEHPRRLNVMYYDDGVQARWLAGALTPELRSAAAFGDDPVTVSPWSRNPARFFAAPAERLALPPAEITREGTAIRVTSQRGAQRLAVLIRGPVGRLRVNGVPLPPHPPRFSDSLAPGWHRVAVRAPSVTIDTGTTTALEIVAVDTTFAAPPEARALIAARNRSTAVPSDDGDVTITARRERQ